MPRIFAAAIALAYAYIGSSTVFDLEQDCGASPDDDGKKTVKQNSKALSSILERLSPGDTLVIPNKTYYFMGGVVGTNMSHVTIRLEGTLKLTSDIRSYPKGHGDMPVDAILLVNATNVTLTSSGKGTLDGNGKLWWGYMKYLENTNHRPILLHVKGAKNLLIENIFFNEAPRFNVYAEKLDGCEIRWCDVLARLDDKSPHSLKDLPAFNTDGFDVSGQNVWIHDCNIYNQDDCIAVKKDARNMLFERINASGMGLSIGGIGSGRQVQNITFRNSRMEKTWKGIYIKLVSGRSEERV